MSESLLRQYIQEILGGPDPRATGKDAHGGNLYSTGNGQMAAPLSSKRNSNVLDDEADGKQQEQQDSPQAACCLILSDDGHVLAVSRKDDQRHLGYQGEK
jgi:hypothetical protein